VTAVTEVQNVDENETYCCYRHVNLGWPNNNTDRRYRCEPLKPQSALPPNFNTNNNYPQR